MHNDVYHVQPIIKIYNERRSSYIMHSNVYHMQVQRIIKIYNKRPLSLLSLHNTACNKVTQTFNQKKVVLYPQPL